MKGNKKLLVVAVLLLLIAVSYSTYAIYKSSATSSDSVRPAHWVVQVNNTDVVANQTFTLGSLDCTSGAQVAKVAGTIAPGDSCSATVVVDATGSEVDVTYAVSIDTSALTSLGNSNISVTADSNHDPLTGTISYSTATNAMVKTVVLNIAWTAVDDATTNGQNAKDIATANASNLTIPITVTATQNPTGTA